MCVSLTPGGQIARFNSTLAAREVMGLPRDLAVAGQLGVISDGRLYE